MQQDISFCLFYSSLSAHIVASICPSVHPPKHARLRSSRTTPHRTAPAGCARPLPRPTHTRTHLALHLRCRSAAASQLPSTTRMRTPSSAGVSSSSGRAACMACRPPGGCVTEHQEYREEQHGDWVCWRRAAVVTRAGRKLASRALGIARRQQMASGAPAAARLPPTYRHPPTMSAGCSSTASACSSSGRRRSTAPPTTTCVTCSVAWRGVPKHHFAVNYLNPHAHAAPTSAQLVYYGQASPHCPAPTPTAPPVLPPLLPLHPSHLPTHLLGLVRRLQLRQQCRRPQLAHNH